MATHYRILAWRIPRTEEPGVLQSSESQRVGHGGMTSNFTFQDELIQKKEICYYEMELLKITGLKMRLK